MTGVDFAYIVQWNTRVNGRNLEGVTHEESLIQPPEGNCINWIVGHMIVSRDSILKLVGAEPIAPASLADRYARGSGPISEGSDGVVPLDQLHALLDRSAESLLAAFASLDPEVLGRPAGERTVGERVQFLLLHDTYHAGQIALARRIAGKPGAIA